MNNYSQLNEFERVLIYRGLIQGKSRGDIAKQIGRPKSTVSREIKRNSDHIGYLYPRDAQKNTEMRKARHGSKISRRPLLKTYIIEKLNAGWSPGVIAGRLTKETSQKAICAEAIYQFAYHPNNRDLALWKLFAKAKRKRGLVRKTQAKSNIMHRVSIHQRPPQINDRSEFGHMEGDLMFTRGSQSANILTLVERKSRRVTLVKHSSKHTSIVMPSVKHAIEPYALSCTFDNGSEFAQHYTLNVPTYFCDPGSPWQKGTVENTNGLARRYVPFSLNPDLVTQDYLDSVADTMNNTPRKILDYSTPNEVFMKHANLPSESRVKCAKPALEVLFCRNLSGVALHS